MKSRDDKLNEAKEVEKELKIWDSLIEFRIKLQKCLKVITVFIQINIFQVFLPLDGFMF